MKETAENIITTELAKQNVTEAVIAKLKKDYLPLKINGIDDKEGYKKVHDARIDCRDHRVLAEKICKAGREDANKEQKAWIAKEKEVVAKISEVEQHLKTQEEAIDAIIEAQKIRAERLLKLPGRKTQVVGIGGLIADDMFILTAMDDLEKTDPLDDEIIMAFTDDKWNQIIVTAQGKKLAAQQKIIDDANAKKLLERTIARENELIATGAVLYSDGLGKVYRKGSASVTAQTIKDCIDEGWPKIVEVFQNAVIPPKPTETHIASSFSGAVAFSNATGRNIGEITRPEISEISDEEKLFNFATSLENLSRPIMKSVPGKDVLKNAEAHISLAIELLRK
ncbi:MAG: hypothetical protein JJE45_00385 [Prolixibacteraceae bacterium]|nr:hypothetical protein [Prolixibacteraceae bacterium]